MKPFFASLGIGAFVTLIVVVLWSLYGNPPLDSSLDDQFQEMFTQLLVQWVVFLIPEVVLLFLIWKLWKALVEIQIELGKIRRGLGGRE